MELDAKAMSRERLLWSGEPDLRCAFMSRIEFIWAGAVLLVSALLVILWLALFSTSQDNSDYVPAALTLAFLGLGSFCVPFFFVREARRTVYLLTTHKATVASNTCFGVESTTTPAEFNIVEVTRRRKNYGNVHYRSEAIPPGNYKGYRDYIFFGIKDPDHVAQLMRDLRDLRDAHFKDDA